MTGGKRILSLTPPKKFKSLQTGMSICMSFVRFLFQLVLCFFFLIYNLFNAEEEYTDLGMEVQLDLICAFFYSTELEELGSLIIEISRFICVHNHVISSSC